MKLFKKQALLALFLAAAAMLSVSVSADEPEAASDAAAVNIDELIAPPIELEDMTRIKVTTSMASVPGTNGYIDSSVLFDGLKATGAVMTFLDLETDFPKDDKGNPIVPAAIEIADAKILSIYTATRVPEAVESFALHFDRTGSLGIRIYATNDSLLEEWTQLTFDGAPYKVGEYDVFDIADEPQKYSFYRIDIEVLSGSTYAVNELILFKDASDTSYFYYESDGEVLPGETPELIEVPAPAEEEPAEEPFRPLAGIGNGLGVSSFHIGRN
ncbi:MAG: hypothetical protein IJC71_08850 [Clostridia bacterium]|nr:hypothetical protein [Clostridia bacterium]